MQVLDKYPVTAIDTIAHNFFKLIFAGFVALYTYNPDSNMEAIVEFVELFMKIYRVRHKKEDGFLTCWVLKSFL